MAASVLHLIRREPHSATAAFWASLALFSFGAATLTMLGRGTAIPVPERYSPGGDGFWLAFVALALLTLARRPGRLVTVVNVGLLAAVGVFSVARDASMLIDRRDPDPASCDQCVLDYPLTRGDCFRRCFVWGDAQSVYHMAALRLSLFHDVTPALILPDALSPVIVDMPNRWLNVYVRDYMLSGIPRAAQIHVAPMQGTWDPPLPPPSPFFRGEWSTEVLSQPLTNTWEAVEQLTADFAKVINGVRHGGRWWYLNTPETEPHFSTIEAAFAAQGYRKQVARMTHRFSDARFTLWCFGVGERCADAASR